MTIRKNILLPLALIFLTGYISLSMELMALRQVSYFVGSSAVISSIVIGIFLGAMSAGYFAGTKKRNLDPMKTIGASFLAIAVLAILACSFPLISYYFRLMTADKIYSPITQTFIYSLLFLSVAPFLFGFNTAILSHSMHNQERSNTGTIMGVDTIGSVLGSLATTLIFMPLLGVNYTVILTVGLALAGAYAALRKLWVVLAAVVVFGAAYMVNNDRLLYERHRIVSSNPVNTVSVAETYNGRWLLIDSATHSFISNDGKTAAQYINFINERFIYTIPKNETKDILVLGAGGFTTGILDQRNSYTFVDVDKTLMNVAEKHFLKQKLTANKRFVVQDAGQFLKVAGTSYDLIVMDIFSRWNIPESAITVEFMERMKSRLRPGGVIIMNTIASPTFSDEYSQKLDNTIRAAFPHNLSRHIEGPFTGWASKHYANVLYIYNNAPNSGKIYTSNKSSTIYDKR